MSKISNYIEMKTSEEVNIPIERNGSVLHLIALLHQHLTENKSLGGCTSCALTHSELKLQLNCPKTIRHLLLLYAILGWTCNS